MNTKKTLLIILMLISTCFLWSCKKESQDGMIIFTRTIRQGTLPAFSGNSPAQLMAMAPDGSDLEVLTKDFYSAVSPDVSFDGKFLLFSGKHHSGDAWVVFEMDLANRSIKQITSSSDNCLFPVYMPGEHIAFCRLTENDSLKSASSIYCCKLDGSDLKRLTYNSDSYSFPTVLKDGRILSLTSGISGTTETVKTSETTVRPDSSFLSPSAHQPLRTSFMAMRPDGTKCELFYRGDRLHSRAFETEPGKLIFIESTVATDSTRNIASISYNDPLVSHKNLSNGIKGDFLAVFPFRTKKWLVSYALPGNNHFGLYEFDPEEKAIGKPLYTSDQYTISDIVVVNKREIPRKLPSEVETSVQTGLLLCQNINEWRLHKSHADSARSIEILGLNSSMGFVPVEKDGSFFLKIKADTPFKIRMLDSNGTPLQESCNWMWLRPNERRGCVGCHEDPAEVPENRVPMAVKKSPAEIPIRGSNYIEKSLATK